MYDEKAMRAAAQKVSDASDPVFVRAEWGELKECVYGGYDQFVFPKFLQDADVRPSGAFRQFWYENQERDVRDADPEYFARWQHQIENTIRRLEDLGVGIHLPTKMSDANMKFPRGENHGVLTGWLRDPFVTIGNNVIELAPRSMFHRRQRFAIRHILAATMERGARYFAQPDSGADDSNEGLPGWGYLEGGDILVLGKTVLVGNSGNCSNPEGARWLQHMLGPDYDVQMVRVDPRFSHLDCVMLAPREGVAVVSLECLPDGVPDCIKDWDLIDVPFEITKVHMGCNHLVLNDRTVMMPEGEPQDALAAALKERRFEIIRVPYDEVYCLGGSFRCAHQPLIRS
ncbi:dimethylarginine dimethylaminohydrolase family protein [Microbaculum sp. FT89]|uniref:dimethylarginine dimethylaminohydrolase family protein n=1 Tax=Microbaculum sp. FT89 TaxID=3447298 RepID=UPI003F5364A3